MLGRKHHSPLGHFILKLVLLSTWYCCVPNRGSSEFGECRSDLAFLVAFELKKNRGIMTKLLIEVLCVVQRSVKF